MEKENKVEVNNSQIQNQEIKCLKYMLFDDMEILTHQAPYKLKVKVAPYVDLNFQNNFDTKTVTI